MKPTLLVLAAGLGSRFGGLKQMEPIGPHGEWLLDYSIYDAVRAGFGSVVFVIRREMHEAFAGAIGSKYSGQIDVRYAYQELADTPVSVAGIEDRPKPLGTGHAVYAARNAIETPFAVINADDFYGRAAFESLAHFLSSNNLSDNLYALVGYELSKTLSANGSVSRGVCHLGPDQQLLAVEEHTQIERGAEGVITAQNAAGDKVQLGADTQVSLNCWGFPADFLATLEKELSSFLSDRERALKSEFYLPFAVDAQLKNGKAKAVALPCDSQWLGVTHRDDLDTAKQTLATLVASGAYPAPLWG